MRMPIWQIALAVFLALTAISLLTNIQVVWMSVLIGISAAIASICLCLGR